MTTRTYLVGLPVGITVEDDGTVTVCVYLEEAGDLEVTGDEDEPISREQLLTDSALVMAAYEASAIRVERSAGTVQS